MKQELPLLRDEKPKSGKVRLVVELLIVAALAFAIWNYRDMIFGIETGGDNARTGEEAEGDANPSRASKLFGKSGTSDKTGAEIADETTDPDSTQTASKTAMNVETSNISASVETRSLQPEPTARVEESAPGTVHVAVLEADGSVPDRRVVVVVDELDKKIPLKSGIDAGHRTFDIEPGIYTLYAVANTAEGSEASDPVQVQVRSGEVTPLKLSLPAPPGPTEAHPGIDVALSDDGSYIQILEIVAGSSAQAAGLQVGDAVIMIDEFAIADLTPDEIYFALRGDPGSNVTLALAFQDPESGELLSEKVVVNRNVPE